MNVAEHIEVTVNDIALGGEGVARHEGRVIFVPFTTIGERCCIEIVQVRSGFSRGRLVKTLVPGKGRQASCCPYFEHCNGCQYHHLNYEEELRVKTNQVRETLKRIGRLNPDCVRDIIPSPRSVEYRNRITVHAQSGTVGFYEINGHTLMDIEQCAIAMPEVNDALHALRQRHPRDGHYSVRSPDIPPSGFVQSNHSLNNTFRELVVQQFTSDAMHAIEGYCGGGFFTELLAGRFSSVVGIESDPRPLHDARRISSRNIQWLEGRFEEILPQLTQSTKMNSTALLIDPPREGLPASALKTIGDAGFPEIVYVSCNPATLARDGQKLSVCYTLKSVQPIDLFPRTAQIECIVKFSKMENFTTT